MECCWERFVLSSSDSFFPLSSTISKIFEYWKRKRRKKYLKSVYRSVQFENCSFFFFFFWKRREEETQLTSCDRSHHQFIIFPLSSTISKIFEY